MAEINSKAAHAFTIALLEAFYEKPDDGRVSNEELLKLRGSDDFIDNDEFVNEYEESVWTIENSEKFGEISYDDLGNGYHLSND